MDACKHSAHRLRRTPVAAGASAILVLAGLAAAAAPARPAPPNRTAPPSGAANDGRRDHGDLHRMEGGDARRVADAMRQNSVTLENAIDAAQDSVNGKAIDARPRLDGGRAVIDVGVLADSGAYSVVCVDATTGKVIATRADGAASGAATMILKGSDVIGEEVAMATGEKVGDIMDVIVDSSGSRIAYVVVDLDGVGDSRFAVPWSALRYDGELVRVDGMTLDRFRSGPAFSSAAWPSSWNDMTFGRKVGDFYGRSAYGDGNWTAGRLSEMDGRNVKNTAGENVGEIEDVAIDASTGRIAYAVLSFGGFLGINDKLFAVPVDALVLQSDGTYRLAIEKERLKDAPGFDKKHWPTAADAKFDSAVRDFYRPAGSTR